jgi:hypothetical protein
MRDRETCAICGERTASVFGSDDDLDDQLDDDEGVCSWCALILFDYEPADG